MKVEYIHGSPGVHTGNILWDGRWPMRNGKFPVSHPVGGGMEGLDGQFSTSPAMEQFRARGYWASSFPEGDGITMRCKSGQPCEQVTKDIVECFGWEVEVKE